MMRSAMPARNGQHTWNTASTATATTATVSYTHLQATLISGEIVDIKALKASLKEEGARPEASGYSSPPDTNSLLIWDVWITWWNTRKSYYAVNDETEQHLDYTDAVLNDQRHLEQNKSE